MSWKEYEWLCEGAREKQELEWSRTREILAMLYNANRGKGQAAKIGKEIIPLSIDEITNIEPLTLEQHETIIKKFSKFLN